MVVHHMVAHMIHIQHQCLHMEAHQAMDILNRIVVHHMVAHTIHHMKDHQAMDTLNLRMVDHHMADLLIKNKICNFYLDKFIDIFLNKTDF